MKFGTKILGKAIFGTVKKVGSAVDPAKIAARAVDKSVDSLKDDQVVIRGRTWFDWATFSIMHEFRVVVEDKE